MSYPIDLTITGKPTPRTTERPGSARKPQRPLSANKAKSISSNIFGGSADSARARPAAKGRPADRVKSAPVAKKNDAPNASVISKAELDAVKSMANAGNDADDYPVPNQKHPAPDGIPKLQLGNLVDRDEKLIRPLKDYKPSLDTPNSASSVSWGTPNRPPSGKKSRGGGWQVNSARPQKTPTSAKPKKHDDVPSLDLCLSQSNEGLKELAKAARKVHEDIQIEYIGAAQKLLQEQKEKKEENELQNALKNNDKDFANEEKEENTTTDASSLQLFQNKLGESKKNFFIEETLLGDQLSRTSISEPTSKSDKTSTKFDPKQQRHKDLFSTRSPITGMTSENSLSKRLRFGARIVTRDGHDAHREINGFFFPSDGTITMYEFRQFGTRANALPFIQRSSYRHTRGGKKGQEFTLLDISVGNELSFTTAEQSSLPDSLKSQPIIIFKVTEVDSETKEKLIYDGCRNAKDRSERSAWVDSYETDEEKQQKELLLALRGSLQSKIKKRAVRTVTNLAKYFRKIDKSGDGFLDQSELRAALKEFRIEIPEEHFDFMWQTIDTNHDEKLDYGEFLRGFLGEMNEHRKSLVRKAFARVDTAKTGWARKDDLKKFFSAKKHPKVLKGEVSEKEITDEFLSAFESSEKSGEVTFAEFIDFYEGLSIQTDTDVEFAAVMRSTWGV